MNTPIEHVALDLDLEQIAGPPEAAARPTLELIATDELVIDGSYQRLVSKRGLSRIKTIRQEFSWARFGALTVAATDEGTFAVIDGQHRAIAAWSLRIAEVPAIVVKEQMQGQATAFVGINTVRGSVASVDKFRARVAAGDTSAVAVSQMLAELEVTFDCPAGTKMKPRQTQAVATLEKLVSKMGQGLTFTTLELMIDAQPKQDNLLTRFAIEAVAGAVATISQGGGDMDRLLGVIEEIDFESLSAAAYDLVRIKGGMKARHGTDQLMLAYNKGLKNKVAAR